MCTPHSLVEQTLEIFLLSNRFQRGNSGEREENCTQAGMGFESTIPRYLYRPDRCVRKQRAVVTRMYQRKKSPAIVNQDKRIAHARELL